MGEASTQLSGFFIDPLIKVTGVLMKSTSVTVRPTVRMLTNRVIEQVNDVYSLDPPLQPDDMSVDWCPDANSNDNIHGLDEDDCFEVFVQPKQAARKRIKQRFRTLQETERKTVELIKFIHDSDEDTDTVDDRGMDDLVNLFKGLRKDIGDQKAETERLKRSLRQEQEERKEELRQEQEKRKEELRQEQEKRKEDTARLEGSLRQEQKQRKEETARLNRLLLLEEENRRDENEGLTTEIRQLKVVITKEREERKAVVAGLEGTIERQGMELEECQREVRNAKEQHANDMKDISELTRKLVPLHLRVLLDSSREMILDLMEYKNWNELRKGKNIPQLTDMIVQGLGASLSRETVVFLCSYNNIRKHGDEMAHIASQIEIKNAVMREKNSEDGLKLEELYKFVFSTPI